MSEKRLYRTVAKTILDMIEAGSYPPGTRLPGERELASMLGVSRVVVREAEISLETLGLVERRVGAGVYVCKAAHSNTDNVADVSAFELTQTRLLFESECAALAATMITDQQIDALKDSIDRMAQARVGTLDGEEADRDFHLQIAQATGNRANVVFLQNLWRMRTELAPVRRVYQDVCSADNAHRVAEHTQVMEALAARDPQASREAMRNHFSRLFEALLAASERQAIDDARKRTDATRERYLKAITTR